MLQITALLQATGCSQGRVVYNQWNATNPKLLQLLSCLLPIELIFIGIKFQLAHFSRSLALLPPAHSWMTSLEWVIVSILGTRLRSSAGVSRTLNHWAFSLTSSQSFIFKSVLIRWYNVHGLQQESSKCSSLSLLEHGKNTRDFSIISGNDLHYLEGGRTILSHGDISASF